MRDVLTVIHGILVANSLSTALSQGVPAVLQKHLDALQQDVQQQLTPPPAALTAAGAAGSNTTQLQGQVRTGGGWLDEDERPTFCCPGKHVQVLRVGGDMFLWPQAWLLQA